MASVVSLVSYLKSLVAPESGGLSDAEAYHVMAAILDGGMPDLELGGMLVALQLRGLNPDELRGFAAAVQARTNALAAPATPFRPVLLPSYGSVRQAPNFTPLLALLLNRFGVPVVVHGTLDGGSGTASAYVLRALDVLPSATLHHAQRQLEARGVAFVPTAVLAPGLAALLALKNRLGVGSFAATLAQLIDPFAEGAVRIVGVGGSAGWTLLGGLFAQGGGEALLLDATEGEPFADPLRRPRIVHYSGGRVTTLFEREGEALKRLPNLPDAHDPGAIAAWTRAAVAREVSLPLPIINQLAACLYATGFSQDMNQAKAIAAVETGTLAAA